MTEKTDEKVRKYRVCVQTNYGDAKNKDLVGRLVKEETLKELGNVEFLSYKIERRWELSRTNANVNDSNHTLTVASVNYGEKS